MKSKQLISLSLLLLLLGCKKENISEEVREAYYLKASINGKECNFNVELSAKLTSTNSPDGLRGVITGTQYLADDTSRLSFGFVNYNNYSVTSATYPNNNIDLLVVYQKSSSKDIYYNNDYSHLIKFTLVVEEITNSYMTGSFNGTIMDLQNRIDSFTVTNGKFKVPIVR